MTDTTVCCICQFLKLNLWSIPNPCLFQECFYNTLNIISNYIREIKHRVSWRYESLMQNFCSPVIWKVWHISQEALQAWSLCPEQVVWQGTPNSHQPDEPAGTRNFHKSSLAVFQWKCSHPRSLPFRNLSLTNWHSLVFGFFPPIKNAHL